MTTTVLSPEVTIETPTATGAITGHGHSAPASLLPEQRELLGLLADGLSDQAIGRRLGLSRRTVQRRVRSLMDHYSVQTRFQLGLRAADQLSLML